MNNSRPYIEPSWLDKKHWNEKLSLRQMGKEANVDGTTILYWMKKYSIPRRSKSEAQLGRRRGNKNPMWRGGRSRSASGYIRIWRPNHPNANGDGYVLEHVLVVSKQIGRALTDGETVHHVNGIKDDNRIENLELWSSRHPKGQRVEDMIGWCHDYLLEYAPILLVG